MSHEWDKFDKTDPAFIAGMNYQRFLLRKPEIGDTIYLSRFEDDSILIETKLIFSNICEDDDGFERMIYSITRPDEIKNIEGGFYCFYDNWERIR